MPYHRAILFDLIGTTIRESDPETINNCFRDAVVSQGIIPDKFFIQQNRGKSKREVIAALAQKHGLPLLQQEVLYTSFLSNVAARIHNFESNDSAHEVIMALYHAGWFVAVGTGLPRATLEQIVTHVQWSRAMIHYLGVAEEIGVGRPDPAMLHHVMRLAGIDDPQAVVKVGDTRVDIEEGKNAGVVTIALDAGTQPRRLLEEAQPDYMIQSLRDLLPLLLRPN